MTTFTAFYDLEHGPVSYDFITWLVRARLRANESQCDRLHVVIVPHETGLGGFSRHWGPHDEAAARWRLWHIVLPACVLAGATVTLADSIAQAAALMSAAGSASWWPESKAHLARNLAAEVRTGARLPVLRASDAARRYVAQWFGGDLNRLVTLTLRDQPNDAERNTDRKTWAAFEDWLFDRGHLVATLHDTHTVLCRGINLGGASLAAADIDLRLALYEHAAMNFVANTGPAALLWHSAAPYRRMAGGEPACWTENLGLAQGEQPPWALNNQRVVYAPATLENLIAAAREALPQYAL